MIAKVWVSGQNVRTVRGDSVAEIAATQFRGGAASVQHDKGSTWKVTRDFGAECSGVVGRIRIVEEN